MLVTRSRKGIERKKTEQRDREEGRKAGGGGLEADGWDVVIGADEIEHVNKKEGS